MSLLIVFTILISFINSFLLLMSPYRLQIVHVQQMIYFPFSSIYLVSTFVSNKYTR